MKKYSIFIVSQLYSMQHPAQNLAYVLYIHSFFSIQQKHTEAMGRQPWTGQSLAFVQTSKKMQIEIMKCYLPNKLMVKKDNNLCW